MGLDEQSAHGDRSDSDRTVTQAGDSDLDGPWSGAAGRRDGPLGLEPTLAATVGSPRNSAQEPGSEATLASEAGATRESSDFDAPTAIGLGSDLADSELPRPSNGRPRPVVPGYEILGELGRGAMGVVYHARQVRLNRVCALKMILAGEHAGPEASLRFLAEAEAIARLQHPNVIQIHTFGEVAGLPFVDLEFAPGGSLEKRLDGTPWKPRRAAEILLAIARGVAEAHRLGIVHRDLKPANVLLVADGRPKVTDFGLAKSIHQDSGITGTEAILGTPSYMAPEQAEGRPAEVGPPADVHALGAILYELLTGRPPFRGSSMLETLRQVKTAEPVAPNRLVPGLPRDLQTIVLKCLNKTPGTRYATAGELADDLDRWLAGMPIAARPAPFWERSWKYARRRPWQSAVAALGVASVGVVLGIWGWSYARIGEALKTAEDARLQADSARVKSDRLAASEAAARAESVRAAAGLALDKGVLLADSGRVGRGLLWMARAYESADGLDPSLARAARANLEDWGRFASKPRAVTDLGLPTYNLDLRDEAGLAAVSTISRPQVLDLTALAPRILSDTMGWSVSVGLSGDGRRAAAADGVSVQLWESRSGRSLDEFLGPESGVRPVSPVLDPEGRRIAVLDYVTHKLWLCEPDRGEPGVHELAPSVGYRFVAFSPDGRHLTSVGDDGTTRVWDAETRAIVREFPPLADLSRVLFLPDGSGVFIWGQGEGGHIAVWKLVEGRLRFQRSIGAAIGGVAFSADGSTILLGGRDGSIRALNANNGEPAGPNIRADSPIGAGGSPLTAVDVRPDGRSAVTVHDDATARFWDPRTGRATGSILEHPDNLVGAGFGSDGRSALTVTSAGQAVLWELAEAPTGRPLAHRPGLGLNSGAVSPDGRLVVAWGNGPSAILIDVETGLPRAAPLLHEGEQVRLARFSPDSGLLATGGDDRSVRLWDRDGRPAGPPLSGGHWVTNLHFSPDGRTLAAITADRTLQTWDVANGVSLGRAALAPPGLHYDLLRFSPDGRSLITCDLFGTYQLWESRTLRLLGESPPSPPKASALPAFDGAALAGFSTDGRDLWLVDSGESARSWVVRRHDPATLLPIGPPLGPGESVHVSPDGRRLLTRAGSTARLLDAASGDSIGLLLTHPSTVLTMAFSPDGSIVATGSADGNLRFWDAETGRPIGPTRPHPGPVASLQFLDRGDRLVTFVGVPRLWEVPEPSADDPGRVAAEVRVASMLELGDDDSPHPLDADAWRSWRERLGPPPGRTARLDGRLARTGRPPLPLRGRRPRGALAPGPTPR